MKKRFIHVHDEGLKEDLLNKGYDLLSSFEDSVGVTYIFAADDSMEFTANDKKKFVYSNSLIF